MYITYAPKVKKKEGKGTVGGWPEVLGTPDGLSFGLVNGRLLP
jgi:hypothetical protein